MNRISTGRLVKREWMVLVAVVVVTLAAFGVYRLHGIFASHYSPKAGSPLSNDSAPFNPKHVVLEVFGRPGATASINYLDVHAQPQRVDDAPLPWTYDATTTDPAVFVNVMAQGSGDSLGCRIIIDDAVKDERVVNEPHAYTFCLDKSG